jgi:CubicO group peptidase (beta-lactamase class C family)
VAALHVEHDPREVGVDPGRMARADDHLARYVDDGKLAGWQLLVTRRGRVVHAGTGGLRDVEAGLPVEPDTLWRIYSMTKPLTSVLAMQLYEEGRLRLQDEVSSYLPAFATSGSSSAATPSSRRPCRRSSRCACGTCSRTRPG